MRYLLLVWIPFFLCAAPFKVATYNVENLFDAQYQGSEYEEYIPGKHNWNKRMVEVKLNHTAEVICDLDADIVGLQEVENANIFKKLIVKLEKVGCAYKYSAISTKKGAAIQVALLSRYPITKKDEIQVSTSPRVRNILEVDIVINGKNLTFFVNHWKSKAYKGYESKRIKYAKALQARIARIAPSKEYILLGDFNSDHNAYLTLEDKHNDSHGQTGFSDILKTKTEEYEMINAGIGVHYTLWKELAIEDRWSHKFYGKRSSLDQIVLPKHMFDGKGIDYVNDSFGVYKADYLFTKKGYINRWRYKNGKHMAKGYSDHLPVFAYFDVKAYVADVKKFVSQRVEIKSIEYLYDVTYLDTSVELKDVVVVLKRGQNAIVKQSPKGRGIFLFGCAGRLKEGQKYDLLVEGIKTYNGLKEVTSAYRLRNKGLAKKEAYISFFSHALVQNDIIKDLEGVYKNRYLYFKGGKMPIYFKKRKSTPKNGTKIKIHYAQIGYYKKRQLVVHSTKDFTVLE